jgi:hypothetical protein
LPESITTTSISAAQAAEPILIRAVEAVLDGLIKVAGSNPNSCR